MNKKVSYTYQYLSRTETFLKFKNTHSVAKRLFRHAGGAHRASAYFRVQGTRPIVPATDSNVGADFISARSAAAFIRKPAATGKCVRAAIQAAPTGWLRPAKVYPTRRCGRI